MRLKHIVVLFSVVMLFASSCIKTTKEQMFYNNSDFNVKTISGKNGAVVSATRQASLVGKSVLQSGGNALDAVVAMQMAIGVTEPHASGLGGGGFIVYYSEGDNSIKIYNGREIAPEHLTSVDVFKGKESNNVAYRTEYDVNYIGIPGILKASYEAHLSYGKLPWRDIVNPATLLAKNGFTVEERLALLYNGLSDQIPEVRKLFKTSKFSLGENLINPELATTMERVSTAEGVKDFYSGKLAREIVSNVSKAGGKLTVHDMQSYKLKVQKPSCIKYRDYKVCTRENHIGLLSALNILNKFNVSYIKTPSDPSLMHFIAESVNAGIAYKSKYDDDFLLKSDQVNKILKDMNPSSFVLGDRKKSKKIQLDNVEGKHSTTGTTSMMARDSEGNIAIINSTVNGYFGAGVVSNGMILNNEMLDFSSCENCVNNIQPGKRPVSFMSPIIVFDKYNRPVLALASAGGIRILTYIVSTLVSILDLGMDVQSAINVFKYSVLNNGQIELEPNRLEASVKNKLIAMGHEVFESDEVISGLAGIQIVYDKSGDVSAVNTGREVRRWASAEAY